MSIILIRKQCWRFINNKFLVKTKNITITGDMQQIMTVTYGHVELINKAGKGHRNGLSIVNALLCMTIN